MERGLEDMSSILKVEDLVKYYGEGENQVRPWIIQVYR